MPRPPSREVGVLAGVAFSVAVGFTIVAPVIPALARSFGVSRTAAGGVVSVFAAMRLVSAVGGGRLVDVLGERRVLALGIGIVGVSSALAGAAQNYPQLLVLRGAGGIGSAMFSVSAISLVLGSIPDDRRGEAAGFFSGAFLLGGVAGPAIGSTVAHLGLRAPFFIYAGTLAVAGAIGLLALPADARGARGSSAGGEPAVTLRQAIGHPAYRAALAAHFADAWSVLGLRSALLPLFVVEALGLERAWVFRGFLVVAAVNAALLLPAGRYADRRGRRPVLAVGLALCALAMAVLAAADGLPAYLTAMALLGLGSGMLDVAPAAVVGDIVKGRSGTSVAVYQMAGDAGSVVGPLATGQLADSLSYGAAFGLTSGVLLGAAALAVVAPETRRRTSTPAAETAVALAPADEMEGLP